MGFFGKLIVATVVLLAQTSLGRVFCACPPATPVPVSSKVGPTCRMSMQPGCTCCEGGAKTQVKAKTVKNSDSGKCQVKAEKKQDAKQIASSPDVPSPAALPIQTAAILLAAVIEVPVQTHLVVPRIRPPDPGLHGLRAPPTR